MPSKGSRAAARQAKLRQKRRRGKAAPQVMDTSPTTPADEVQPDTVVEEATPAAVEESRKAAPRRAPRPTRREGQQSPAGAAALPIHLGAELRQIGVIVGIILVLLAALTFVLG